MGPHSVRNKIRHGTIFTDAFRTAIATSGATFPISCLISSIIFSVRFGVDQVEVVTILYSIVFCHSHVVYYFFPSRARYHLFGEAARVNNERGHNKRDPRAVSMQRDARWIKRSLKLGVGYLVVH